MIGKLAPNPFHSTRGLDKYVPGRNYFRAVPSQNGDKFVTSPSPQSLNGSKKDKTICRYYDGGDLHILDVRATKLQQALENGTRYMFTKPIVKFM